MGKYNQGEPWDPDAGDRRLGATNEDTAGLWGLGARASFLNRDRVPTSPDLDAASDLSSGWSPSAISATGNRRVGWIIGGLVLLAVILIAVFVSRKPNYQDPGGEVVVTNAFGKVLSNPELFGKTLYLKRGNSGGYRFTGDSGYDKKLTWDKAEESYYDDETGLWLWFNTDVKPPLWQYWYEPISGDFGNYGWMECEDGRWYIEESRGNWVLLPKKYDASALWYVETDTKIFGNSGAVPVVVIGDSDEDLKTARESTETPGLLADTDEDLPEIVDTSPFGSALFVEEREAGICWMSDNSQYTRVLYWDEDAQCYYDDAVDLWLRYSTDSGPAHWIYRYAPISDAYGDHGWLKFRAGGWYVEDEAGDWVPVPEDLDTSTLWHMARPEDSNLELFGATIRLSELSSDACRITRSEDCDRTLTYSVENGFYQEPETGLWLTYKNNETESHWEYWYWTISPDFIHYGGLEYRDGVWYVQNKVGAWIPVPEEYDTSPLWHIESGPEG